MRIKLSNKQIWEYTQKLDKSFKDEGIIFPAKISYAIQNNLTILLEKYELIEKNRIGIGEKYGEYNEKDGVYHIKKELIQQAQTELEDLLNVEQMIDLIFLTLKDLENCSFTMAQINALHFMIDKESYKEE